MIVCRLPMAAFARPLGNEEIKYRKAFWRGEQTQTHRNIKVDKQFPPNKQTDRTTDFRKF